MSAISTFTYLELVFYLTKLLSEDISLTPASIYLLLQDLCAPLEDLHLFGLNLIRYVMTLVLEDNTLAADEYLIILAKELSLLVGMLQTVLL